LGFEPDIAPDQTEKPAVELFPMAQKWLLWGIPSKNTIKKVQYGGYTMAEEKTRIHTRLSPGTEQKLASAFPKANCRSRNEFVE